MPVFEYTALDAKGKNVSGIIDADSAVTARQRLRSEKKFPVTVRQTSESAAKKGLKGIDLLRPFVRIRATEVTMMTRQLATLLAAGFPLVGALDSMIPYTRSLSLKRALSRIKDNIVEGNSFAASLSLYPGAFSPVYVNMVRAGEASGTLAIVLERLAEVSEKQQALRRRIQSALAYPIFMAFVGGVVLFFLLAYLVPGITVIFEDMNQVLPAPTRVLIGISDFLKARWWVVLGGIAICIFALGRIRRTRAGRYWFDRRALTLPLVGGLTRKLAAVRFSRTLGSLLENGVTMLAALEIVKNLVGNVIIADAVAEAAKEVGKGVGLGVFLDKTGVFPPLAVQMIQVGEQSGELESMLLKVADAFETEVEAAVNGLTSLLGPAMVVVMGSAIGFIVVSICLPIFEMNQLVR